MSNDRLQAKNDLLIKLGMLFGPLQQLVAHPQRYDDQEVAETIARYAHDAPDLAAEFKRFSMGQPGHNYTIQYQRFYQAVMSLTSKLLDGEQLKFVLPVNFVEARGAIDSVPVPRTSVILDAGTPFSTYVRLKQLVEADATSTLAWLDPYVDDSIFHRFLAGVRVPITLVTTAPGPNAGRRDVARWKQFLDVSALFAAERGEDQYRLLTQSSLHDRWIVLDKKRIYSLGGSAKDAGARDYFTIASVDASQGNLDKVRSSIDAATEIYGPNVSAHP